MPEYRNAKLLQADQLNRQATEAFDAGTQARENSEQYIRGTVLLATILFLIALAQRFKIYLARAGLLFVATALIVYVLTNVAHYPKL
jgi:NADH:ubiquinone oxidoreductase subunit 3 (subunit A)